MHTATLRAMGGSVSVTLPRQMLRTLSLAAGASVATEGVVLCNQARSVDLKARRAQFIEAAPPELVADVLARVATLIE